MTCGLCARTSPNAPAPTSVGGRRRCKVTPYSDGCNAPEAPMETRQLAQRRSASDARSSRPSPQNGQNKPRPLRRPPPTDITVCRRLTLRCPTGRQIEAPDSLVVPTGEQTAKPARHQTLKTCHLQGETKPSNGLEPLTPSLPCHFRRRRWQPLAKDSAQLCGFRQVWAGDLLPPIATAGLHKGSIRPVLRRPCASACGRRRPIDNELDGA